jgi:phosphatidylglycerol:prolipoprotein diacylglycerol transferase
MLLTLSAWLTAHGHAWLVPYLPRSGIAYAIATVVVAILGIRRMVASGIPERRALWIIIIASVGLAIGPRLYTLVISGDLWRLPPAAWFSSQNVASWGAYLGIAAGAIVYCLVSRPPLPVPRVFDAIFSCAALAEVIARGACMLNGDDYGVPTTLPWGVRFLPGSMAYAAHRAAGLIPPGAPTSLSVHPLPVYLAAASLLTFLLTTAVWRRWRTVPGLTFSTFLLSYGTLRFPLEFLRDPSQHGAVTGLSSSQVMCLVLVAAGGVTLLAAMRRMPHRERSVAIPDLAGQQA